MYSEDQILLNLLSTTVNSTSTVANATIDMLPYFNVQRREVGMVYTLQIASTASETVTITLQGADATASANSTNITFTDVAGSSVISTALGASLVSVGLTTVQPLTLTQRYLRVKAVGSASTAAIPIAVGIVLIRRNTI
jgi:hypothetical protein